MLADQAEKMTDPALRSGLFSRLLAACVAAALVCAAVATVVFHGYRDAIIQAGAKCLTNGKQYVFRHIT